MKLTWLGQAGFRIELGGVCIVVDPWASPHELRLAPPPPWAVVAEGIDWVLVTHEHLDHLDPPVLRLAVERSPTARVVIPGAIAPKRLGTTTWRRPAARSAVAPGATVFPAKPSQW